jgi:hypothetical protein
VALQLEILALRHQLGVLQRSVRRPKLIPADRFWRAWLLRELNDWQPGVYRQDNSLQFKALKMGLAQSMRL